MEAEESELFNVYSMNILLCKQLHHLVVLVILVNLVVLVILVNLVVTVLKSLY